MSNYIPLKEYAKEMGICSGDIVFISSDTRTMLFDAMRNKASYNLNDFIDGVVNAVGKDGTVLIPTYNWGFCKGKPFDYRLSPCQTGSLGSIALGRSDFKRTKHPIYSFAVYGKDQELLTSLNNIDSFGADSPFNYLKEKNAINYIIDVSLQHCFTFAHYVEEYSNIVTYRYIKSFVSDYIDETGEKEKKTYSMFVRDLNMDVENLIDPIEEDLIRNGAGLHAVINNSHILRVELGKAFGILLDDVLNNKSRKICRYKGQDCTS